MSRSIYIITSGTYSDYHIVGVWESRKKAAAWLEDYKKNTDLFSSESMGIEEWPFEDDPEFAEFRRTTVRWRVQMSESGEVKHTYIQTRPESSPAELRAPSRSGWAPAGFFYSEGVATSEEHAIKIAAEKWAEWKWKKEQKKAARP